MTTINWWNAGILTALACAAGCVLDEQGDEQLGESSQAIEGRVSTYEFAADAPWRMEPTTGPCQAVPSATCNSYGPIPIQLAIFDARLQNLKVTQSVFGRPDLPWLASSSLPHEESYRRLVQVKSVTVYDLSSGTTHPFTLGNLHEVEMIDDQFRVQNPNGPAKRAPTRSLCRKWAGDDCRAWGYISNTSEWHGTLMFAPTSAPQSGQSLRLRIEIRVSQRDESGQLTTLPDAVLTQHVAVKYGDEPLPRFGDGWAYGDLHYHSQGTDNEGETGHSFRGVVYAMAAIGLDFAFATDHASASSQITRFDMPVIDFWHEDLLRDTDPLRFSEGLRWIHEPGGANSAATSMPRLVRAGATRIRVPQLYLGGEVDVIPETPIGPTKIPYGNGKLFDLNSCDYPLPVELFAFNTEGGCLNKGVSALLDNAGDGRWLIRDVQGPASIKYYARQHFLNLPFDPGNAAGYVTSKTSMFGGATRRLAEVLRTDYDSSNKGLMFLAHPVAARDGAGYGEMGGPDLVPYTQVQLDDAFASRHVLGLQLWNEDARMSSAGTKGGQPGIQGVVSPFVDNPYATWDRYATDPKLFSSLHHGAALWDRMLRKGINENEIRKLSWLPTGQPRRVLMAGGSDAHGDFNYRRTGYMIEEIAEYVDTALGKPRNMVFAGLPQGTPLSATAESAPFTQQQIMAGIQAGHFSVTDGPAVRIAWDVNRNGVIDFGDVHMGGQVDYTTTPPPLLVQWVSTREFGAVKGIDLYVGVRNEENDTSLTYAPENHGVRGSTDPRPPMVWNARPFTDARTGRRFERGADGYYMPLDGSLHIELPGDSMSGTMPITIDPANFPVGIPNEATRMLDQVRRADRMYVRAFARTGSSSWDPQTCWYRRGDCISRLAFTNPVWARAKAPSPSGTLMGYFGKCATVQNVSTANGARLVTWDCASATNQRFSWFPSTGEITAFGGQRVDLLGWNSANGAPVGIWEPNGSVLQQWRFTNLALRAGGTNQVLSVFSGNTADGAAVGLWPGNGYPDQKWELTSTGELRGIGGKCLDVLGTEIRDGMPVRMWTCYGSANQKWELEHGGRIRGLGGQCLTVADTGSLQGANMVMRPCSNSPLQVWTLRGEIRGWGDKCLDVYNAQTGNGTPIDVYTCHGGDNQQWSYYP